RVALAEERVQTVGTFEPAEPRGRRGIASGTATRADHPHARARAEAADLPADAPRAHHADGFVLEEKRAVRAMVESVTLPIARGVVKAAGEVEDAGQRVLGHRAGVAVAAGGGRDHVAAPQVAAEQVAGPGRQLVEPAQPRRPRAQIQRERKAA